MRLVADVDVVVHLAFIVLGSRTESERVNLAGTRIVFEAAVAAERVTRLVYTSSAAAYGYYADNPDPLTEDVPPRGSPEHDYSAQKAACEAALTEITEGSSLEVFVLRPCIVAGPKATALADAMPWNRYPSAYRSITRAMPLLRLPFPDPGVPLQLVHHDDVAAAIALAATTSAPPGAYNIAGDGATSLSKIAAALGGRPVRVPPLLPQSGRRSSPDCRSYRRSRHRPRGANVSADGYGQGQVAAGLGARVHRRANPGGTRRTLIRHCGYSTTSRATLARTDKRPVAALTNNRSMQRRRPTDRDTVRRRVSAVAAMTLVGLRLIAIGIPATEPQRLPAGSPSPRAVRQTFTIARAGFSLSSRVSGSRQCSPDRKARRWVGVRCRTNAGTSASVRSARCNPVGERGGTN